MRFTLFLTITLMALSKLVSGVPAESVPQDKIDKVYPYWFPMNTNWIQEKHVYGVAMNLHKSIGITKFCQMARFIDHTDRMGPVEFAEVQCYDFYKSKCIQDLTLDWHKWYVLTCKPEFYDISEPRDCPGMKREDYWDKPPEKACKDAIKTDHYVTTRNRLQLIDQA